MAETASYLSNIFIEWISPGVLAVNIRTAAYPGAADHWKAQLTGENAKKWGRIFIDPSAREGKQRRRDALHPWGDTYKGEAGANLDECPGAMFVWETQAIAHVEPVDARSNQDLGRDMYHALRRGIRDAIDPSKASRMPRRGEMGWWEVRFRFDDFG